MKNCRMGVGLKSEKLIDNKGSFIMTKKNVSGMNTIMLASGKYFDFNDPENSDFDIEDIAHSLSHMCRYVGHTPYFYSVAEHSIHTSYMVPDEHKLQALLHDAAEAFIGDVSTPLKNLLPDYRRLEKRVERAVFRRLGVDYPFHSSVKEADKLMLLAEQKYIFKNDDIWLEHDMVVHRPPFFRDVGMSNPVEVKREFLERYDFLKEKENVHVAA